MSFNWDNYQAPKKMLKVAFTFRNQMMVRSLDLSGDRETDIDAYFDEKWNFLTVTGETAMERILDMAYRTDNGHQLCVFEDEDGESVELFVSWIK